ncbi:MAG: MATE family efflux transporter [Eubacteriales bacterium]|nr:MATE family efflux transporter [Eubacteriales bacterium]
MKKQVKQMTTGHPMPLIVSFAIPLMFGNIFQQMYSVVDSMVVGRNLGIAALASLGICNWPNWIMIGMLQGLAQGISIRLANSFGSGKTEELKKSFYNSILLSGAFMVFLLILSELLSLPMLRLLGTADELIPDALLYLRIVFAGIPFIMVYNLLAAALRALGNSRTPLIAMAVASVANVLLDIWFVVGFHWGIAGAAIATVLAQVLAMLICLKTVLKIQDLHFSREHMSIHWGIIGDMLLISTPMALQNFLIAGGGMVVQSAANQFSVLFIAGFTAGGKMHGLLEIATSSFGFAMTTYVAQNLGARKMDRIHHGVRCGILAALITSFLIAAFFLITGKWILLGFVSGNPSDIASTVNIGYRYLAIMCICLPVLYLLYVFRSSLQGLGNTFLPMISAIAELIMRTSSAILLSKLIGQDGVFIAEVAAWFGADFVLITSYFYVVKKTEKMIENNEI